MLRLHRCGESRRCPVPDHHESASCATFLAYGYAGSQASRSAGSTSPTTTTSTSFASSQTHKTFPHFSPTAPRSSGVAVHQPPIGVSPTAGSGRSDNVLGRLRTRGGGSLVVLPGSRLNGGALCDWIGTIPLVHRNLSQGSGTIAVVTMSAWFNVWSEGRTEGDDDTRDLRWGGSYPDSASSVGRASNDRVARCLRGCYDR